MIRFDEEKYDLALDKDRDEARLISKKNYGFSMFNGIYSKNISSGETVARFDYNAAINPDIFVDLDNSFVDFNIKIFTDVEESDRKEIKIRNSYLLQGHALLSNKKDDIELSLHVGQIFTIENSKIALRNKGDQYPFLLSIKDSEFISMFHFMGEKDKSRISTKIINCKMIEHPQLKKEHPENTLRKSCLWIEKTKIQNSNDDENVVIEDSSFTLGQLYSIVFGRELAIKNSSFTEVSSGANVQFYGHNDISIKNSNINTFTDKVSNMVIGKEDVYIWGLDSSSPLNIRLKNSMLKSNKCINIGNNEKNSFLNVIDSEIHGKNNISFQILGRSTIENSNIEVDPMVLEDNIISLSDIKIECDLSAGDKIIQNELKRNIIKNHKLDNFKTASSELSTKNYPNIQ